MYVPADSLALTAKEVKHTGSATGEEAYAITATLDKDVQINVTFTKPASAPGYKYGTGAGGGISTFNHKEPKDTHIFVSQWVYHTL